MNCSPPGAQAEARAQHLLEVRLRPLPPYEEPLVPVEPLPDAGPNRASVHVTGHALFRMDLDLAAHVRKYRPVLGFGGLPVGEGEGRGDVWGDLYVVDVLQKHSCFDPVLFDSNELMKYMRCAQERLLSQALDDKADDPRRYH